MKNFALLFFGIIFTIAFSFTGIVLSSHVQFGGLKQTTSELDENGQMMEGETLYPLKEGGLALQGKQVYIEMGCIYCHSQQVRRQGFGADIDRSWGVRATVARDYILQDRVLLGTMRTGPDLAHVGGRFAGDGGREWHHQHLYNPQITSKGSNMPPFAFLYEVRAIEGERSPNAVKIADDSPYGPGPGYEVIPTRRAEALVEYLLSLKVDYSLPEAPILD
ncbi:cbb3-type cytochrome c oxidase subunit II [Coraliomargarita akajimensis]|uniref:Cytochrome C oxidase mono-heme subunit/FixO n=1 Tax=Coraliomargarita akajimensis (strain DSM 45221 / IAM 15411 / JCM 23193 / KCTC 12865 / 04OKA010-24) TaxID=583355 RepID=D5EKH4_CORAD|nr:cbb3-type cytochrome c oxidase subunit II [Coraliomargarita akajimensis]ADE53055.1 cytochrome C oxidase mono-heme subunit/FixO [Coraliomargarita akajimensis DSM 45221]